MLLSTNYLSLFFTQAKDHWTNCCCCTQWLIGGQAASPHLRPHGLYMKLMASKNNEGLFYSAKKKNCDSWCFLPWDYNACEIYNVVKCKQANIYEYNLRLDNDISCWNTRELMFGWDSDSLNKIQQKHISDLNSFFGQILLKTS